jgi:hypothetical protein
MEPIPKTIEPFFEKAEAYGKTSLELWKLKSVWKSADLLSTFISRLIFSAVVSLFILTLTVALGLWLGELLGKTYLGFFLLTGIYGITGFILYFVHPAIKARVNNSIVNQLLN